MSAWTESYNVHTRVLIPRVLSIVISWEGSSTSVSGYRVNIGNRSLKNLIGDLGMTKIASIGFAERLLIEFKNNIEDMKGETQE